MFPIALCRKFAAKSDSKGKMGENDCWSRNWKNVLCVFTILTGGSVCVFGQTDTLKTVQSKEILVKQFRLKPLVDRMPDEKDLVIYAGKKTEVIKLRDTDADLSTNNARQIFSRVPGVSVWESDGSGIQTSIAVRGLSPNRSWEFNVRQNGSDIAAEAFGYPESYFSPPTEAVEKIEVVRGAASLQFGPQFGGLLNYQIKTGNLSKKLEVESQQTVGSFGLLNSYTAVGGTVNKVSYYSYLHRRSADGWRENSRYSTLTGYGSFIWGNVKRGLTLKADFTHMQYESQQPGGLTDQQFAENSRQSSRSRNWFSVPWNVASVSLDWIATSRLSLRLSTFGTLAERNSVGFLSPVTVEDKINPDNLQFNPRQVDRDQYRNAGAELRATYRFSMAGSEQTLAGGIRTYYGNTIRKQLGTGTTGSDLDFTLTSNGYGREFDYQTRNTALFAEQLFTLGSRWKLVPGVRLEMIGNSVSGRISTSPTGKLEDDKRTRNVLLYGMGSEFKLNETMNLYANYSRSFRPVTFSELTPSSTTETVDPNLKDASGFNADLGFRGTWKNCVQFDAGLFYLHYSNRSGIILKDGANFRTNIGTSVSKGIESFIEADLFRIFGWESPFGSIRIFTSNAWIDARYTKWNNPVLQGDPVRNIENKRVENAPEFIHRAGISYLVNALSVSLQWNSVSKVYTDAANTESTNPASTIGKIPGYEVLDLNISFKASPHFLIKAGINNLSDNRYATRRSTGYPGPGLLPGNGRSFYGTVSVTL